MPYPRPPIIASLQITSSAVAFTYLSTVVLAAPGVNRRYRVVGFQMAKWINAGAGAGSLQLWLEGNVSAFGPIDYAIGSGSVGGGGGGSSFARIIEPGYVFAINRALSIGSISEVVSAEAFVTLAYFIDEVS